MDCKETDPHTAKRKIRRTGYCRGAFLLRAGGSVAYASIPPGKLHQWGLGDFGKTNDQRMNLCPGSAPATQADRNANK